MNTLPETHYLFKLECQSQLQVPDWTSSSGTPMAKSFSSSDGQATNKELRGTIQLEKKFEAALPDNRSHKRNLRHAFNILNMLKYELSLPAGVIENSARYYQRTLNRNIVKGRSIRAFAVASLYVACREFGIPRQLREIAIMANVNPVIARKCYRILLRNLELNLPFVDCDLYLSKIAKDLPINDKTYHRGLEILEMVKENFLLYGKDPKAVATAVLYVACLMEGENIIQSRIAAAGNISIVTLRKRAIDVIKVISEVRDDLKH